MRERSEAYSDQKFVEKSKKSKRLRSLSETLDDQTIDKYLDQYLSALGGDDDNDNNERKQKVKAATIMDLLADDLMEHLSGDEETLKSDNSKSDKNTKTSDAKKSDSEKVDVKDEL